MPYKTMLIALILAAFAVPAVADCDLAATGKTLVEKNRCAICHRDGGLAQPLAGIAEGKTDEFLQQAVSDPKQALGAGTRMPAYKLSEDEMKALIQYLRSLSTP